MGFSTALSGLSAASKNLQVTGNNIANANTTGFKKSRAEFADVYATSLGGGRLTVGSGVTVADVSQQFDQGSLEFSDNTLDMALKGEGFFTLGESLSDIEGRVYTRSGEFKLNKDGIVVNNQGKPLLVYQANGTSVEEGFSQGVLQTLQLNSTQGLPTASSVVTEQVNLDATKPDLATTTTFDPGNSSTYTNQTSVSVFDSLGDSHTLTSYFVAGGVVAATAPATGNNREWEVYQYIDGNPVDVSSPSAAVTGTGGVVGEKLVFNSTGQLVAPVPGGGNLGDVQLSSYPIAGSSASPLAIKLSYADSTHIASAFSVDALNQNGLPAGQLTGLNVDDNGVVFARFSNGASKPLGQVALTRFANPQGLTKLGDTTWGASGSSGEPISGAAGANNFGSVQASALESSNVDLSSQLVNLIIAQQAYQANAQTLSTENTITQTILNIR